MNVLSQQNLTKIINNKQLLEIPPELYQELKTLARHALKSSRKNATLDTHAVVHEAVLKIYEKQSMHFKSRGHFYALISQVMRHTVIDYARKKQSQKHGGGIQQIGITQLDEAAGDGVMGLDQLISMEHAMAQLLALDQSLEQLIMMRFYGGLDIKELASLFECSESSVKRNLRTARAFLKSKMAESID